MHPTDTVETPDDRHAAQGTGSPPTTGYWLSLRAAPDERPSRS